MTDNAFIAAYDGIDLALPDGRTVRAKPLTISQQARFLGLSSTVAKGGQEGDAACLAFMAEFPKAIGLERECDGLHLSQLFQVFNFFLSGAGLVPKPTPEAAAAQPAGTT